MGKITLIVKNWLVQGKREPLPEAALIQRFHKAIRHSGESRNPGTSFWIPTFAGMTREGSRLPFSRVCFSRSELFFHDVPDRVQDFSNVV